MRKFFGHDPSADDLAKEVGQILLFRMIEKDGRVILTPADFEPPERVPKVKVDVDDVGNIILTHVYAEA